MNGHVKDLVGYNQGGVAMDWKTPKPDSRAFIPHMLSKVPLCSSYLSYKLCCINITDYKENACLLVCIVTFSLSVY